MTRTQCFAALAVGAAIAAPAAYAHVGAHAHINGPDKLGTVVETEEKIPLPGVAIDCPGPEGATICKVTVTVKSRKPVRWKVGGKRKIVTLGRSKFSINPNSDAVAVPAVPIKPKGHGVIDIYGKVKAIANVHVASDDTTFRDFKLTLQHP